MTEKSLQLKFNKWRLIPAALGILAVIWVELSSEQLLIKFDVVLCGLFMVGGLLDVRVKGWISRLFSLCSFAVAGAVALLTSQFAAGWGFEAIPLGKMALGAEVALSFILIVYCVCLFLLPKAVKDRAKPAIIVGAFLLMLLGAVNYYTTAFRGSPLTPDDLLSARTAMNVMDQYSFSVPLRMRQALLLYAAAVFVLSGIKAEPADGLWLRRVVALLALVLVSLHLHFALGAVKIEQWGTQGPYRNGFIMNFAGQLQQMIIVQPAGYGEERIKGLEEKYNAENADTQPADHVIVIMNEAFADMRVWGEINTDKPVMYYYDSLRENTVKGYALSSILGGTTANSEYEFLTGNSMAFLSPSSVPFQQFVKENVYNVENYLDKLGYASMFTHPELAENWMRDKVYPKLGFEETMFLEAYEDSDKYRIFVSDEGLYDKLIEEYESRVDSGSQFIFAVSMQNHSPYKLWAENVEEHEKVHLTDFESPETEQYLSCIYTSNMALEKLLNYFEQREERVVILMYGDHQPVLPEEFYSNVYGAVDESLDTVMLKHYIPFVIWANYDIEEKDVELTSINFLSNYLLEAAGLPLSPYNSFLRDVQEVIPAMNAYGYWSKAEGCFKNFDEAQGLEKEMLTAYEMLQYNSMFDKKGRSEVFFPMN